MEHALRSSTIRLRTLGGLGLTRRDGSEVDDLLARPKELALLVYLAVTAHPDSYVGRDFLLALFWPGLDDRRARHALRQMLYSLRQRLGSDAVVRRGSQEVRVDPDALSCDATKLREASQEGRLEAVVELYGGEFLAGFHPGDVSVEFEYWVDELREELRREAMDAAQTLAERTEAAGNLRGAIAWSRKAVEIDPLSEADAHRLVRLLEHRGSAPQALEAYERYRVRLQDELGLSPGQELQDAIRRLRAPLDGAAPAQGAQRSPAPSPAPSRAPSPAPSRARTGHPPGGAARTAEPRRSPRVLAMVLSAAVVAPALAFGVSRWVTGRTAGPVPATGAEEGPRVAFVPVEVREEARPLAARIAYASTWSLADVEGAHVLDPGRVWAALDAAPSRRVVDMLSTLRRQLDADVVVGIRIGPGDSTALLQAWGPEAAPRPAWQVPLALHGGEVDLEAAAEAARALLTRTLPDGAWREPNAAVLPEDGEALDALVLGDRYLYAGEPLTAMREYERAVLADSGFGLGWYRLSVAASVAFDAAAADSASDRAAGLPNRLPRRIELLNEARRAYRRGYAVEAESTLRDYLDLYPDDQDAQVQLAELALHYNPLRGRSALEALSLFRRVDRDGSHYPEALYHIAQLSLLRGDSAGFRGATADFLSLESASHRAPQIHLLQAMVDGDQTAVRRELGRLEAASDFTVLSAAHNLAVNARSPREAARVASILTSRARAPEVRALGYQLMADLAIARGRPTEAWQWMARAAVQDPPSAIIHHAFLAALPSIPVDSAMTAGLIEAVQSLDADAPPASWFQVDQNLLPELGAYLEALLQLKDGRADTAAAILRSLSAASVRNTNAAHLSALLGQRYRYLTNAPSAPTTDPLTAVRVTPEQGILSPLYSSPDLRYLYAMHLARTGEHRRALRILGSLDEHSIGDLTLAGQARLAAAKIHERLGERIAARRLYAAALDLWSDAEPSFQPLTDDARAGLSRVEDDAADAAP